MAQFKIGAIFFRVESVPKEEYRYTVQLRNVVHEYIHLLYNEYVAMERITWLDEGIALNLSHEKNMLHDEKRFNDFMRNVCLMKKYVDNMGKLSHEGENFVTENYNGYDLSYICVKYLLEVYTKEQFNKLIRDRKEINKIENTILDDAIKFFLR